MKAIVLIVSCMAAGGAQRAVAVLANAWAERGWRVSVFTIDDGKDDHYGLHPKVERVPLGLLWRSRSPYESIRNTFLRLRRIRHEILSRKPTAVLSFLEQTNVRVLSALVGSGIPVIVSEQIDPRRYDPGVLWRFLRRLLYPRASGVVVLTEAVRADWAFRRFGTDRVHVIPNPLYQLPPPRSFDECNTILAMGRLDRQKGFDLLLRAFATSGLPRRGWRLLILGEGSERAELERLSLELAISHCVDMPGIVPEPDRYMQRGAIFAFSSRFEGLGNALLEAMAMGMAVVSFDCESGPSEFIRHGDNGLLIPAEDVPALAHALAALADDSARRHRLGTKALEVRERFDVDSILKKWNDLIERSMRGSGWKGAPLRNS